MPYANEKEDYWTGYFSSRPGAKKQVKDASSLAHAEMKMFSKQVIKEGVEDKQVKKIVQAKNQMLEALAIYLHHDAITGTAEQYVADDYSFRMQKAIDVGSELYKSELIQKMKA